MARTQHETVDTAEQTSRLDELRALMQQQAEVGRRDMLVAKRVAAEIEGMKAELKACATKLDEARTELVELRAAHEREKREREAAEGRVVKLEARISKIRAACEDPVDEGDDPVAAVPADALVDPTAPATKPLAESLGLSEAELAAIDELIVRGGAPNRTEMLRTLVLRGLVAEGLLPGGIGERCAGAGTAKGDQTTWR